MRSYDLRLAELDFLTVSSPWALSPISQFQQATISVVRSLTREVADNLKR